MNRLSVYRIRPVYIFIQCDKW